MCGNQEGLIFAGFPRGNSGRFSNAAAVGLWWICGTAISRGRQPGNKHDAIRKRASRRLTGLDPFPNQAVDALGGFSTDEGAIFLLFLIHSAALCSASSSCSMVIDWLTWFLAWLICSPAIRNHI